MPSHGVAQKKNKIKILGAKKMVYSQEKYGKATILVGKVKFKHNQNLMFCDSAVMISETNTMNAYGHVRIKNKARKTTITGQTLKYNGDQKEGVMRGNIVMENETQILTTNHLVFNLITNISHYYNGGTIIGKEDSSILISDRGHYHSTIKTFFFKDSVSYQTKDYLILTDTMKYNTQANMVHFYGPTNIYSDSNHVYSEFGEINNELGTSAFSQNVVMTSKEQILKGDSVFYSKNTKIGEAFENVEIIDTLNHLVINGKYATYNTKTKTSLVTGNLEMIMGFSKDSLHLHSDTLFTEYDKTQTHRLMYAYHHVQFYKPDMQGKCDSISFSESDSTINMFYTPVVWVDSNQVTGKQIKIKTYDGKIDHMRIDEEAFIVSQEDTALWNQVKGKSLFAHFDSNKIYQIDVNRSGQTIYYVRDEDKSLMGMNRLNCSNMSMYMTNNKIDRIMFYTQPDGTFLPMEKVTYEMKLLRHFYWRIDEKPTCIDDIFRWTDVPEYIVNRKRSR